MAIFIGIGTLVGLFNAIRFAILLVAIGRWTDGSYQAPLITVMQIVGALVCVPMATLAIAGLFKSQIRLRGMELGIVAVYIAAAISSIGLFWVHVEELDVTAAGFRQAKYEITEGSDIRLYNPSDKAVTICLGKAATCDPNAEGPQRLHAPGLTLGPGATTLVSFAKEGHYPLTIVGGSAGLIDADIHVVSVPEDTGPPIY